MTQACAFHPDASAVTTCADCTRPLCLDCTGARGGRDLCAGCVRADLRRRNRKYAVVGLGLLAMMGATLALARKASTALAASPAARVAPAPPDHGNLTWSIATLRARLARAPCDAEVAVALGDELIQADANDEVEPMASAFAARCGRQAVLLWKVYEASRRLGHWDRALAVATDLIEHDPADKDYWWWRGVVHEQRGDLQEALADYRRALEIRPDLDEIPFNVANVHERLKQPCDAAHAIERYLAWHPAARADQGVRVRLDRLDREGRCGEAPDRRATIRFAPGTQAIATQASANGIAGRFLVDTGATPVTLTRAFARRAGVDAPADAAVGVETANGPSTAHLARISSFEVQGVTASGVEAAVVDRLPGDVDGLVGLSFLSRFDVRLEAAEGRLEIAPRAR